jgi:hypothetical protein
MSQRVLVRERALEHIGDDLGIPIVVGRTASAGRKTVLRRASDVVPARRPCAG